eukprot:259810-Chlamydomonas_euryale.AAC.3
MALRMPTARAAPAARPAPAAIRRPSRSPLSAAAAAGSATPGAAAAASAGRRRSADALGGPASGLRLHTQPRARRGATAVPRAEPPSKPEPPSGDNGNKDKKDGPMGTQDERVEAVLEVRRKGGVACREEIHADGQLARMKCCTQASSMHACAHACMSVGIDAHRHAPTPETGV